ncbi:MAG TPA: DUF2142 domain-containing protein [Candidatus Saccharimonadales bacterium]|nr:DUF2142 domain-containing protein [Candidatus Saccharimonadales bacterium]
MAQAYGYLAAGVKKFFANPVQKYFFWTALVFGLLFCIVTPPFNVHDEDTHMYRAYQISRGDFVSNKIPGGLGGQIPASIVVDATDYRANYFGKNEKINTARFHKDWNAPLKASDTVPIHFENTALYPPVAYAPQAITIRILSHFDLSPLKLLYISRIATFLVWLILASLAVYFMPTKKILLAGILLLPMSMFLAGSISADALSNGLAALTVAYYLAAIVSPEKKIGWRQAALMVLMSVLLGLVKQPYWLVGLLSVLLPSQKFASKRDEVIKKTLIIGALIIVAGTWIILSKHIFAPYRHDVVIDPNGQLSFVFSHPLTFIRTLWNTYVTANGSGFIREFVGVLGAGMLQLPVWVNYLTILSLSWYALAPDKRFPSITHRTKSVFVIIAVIFAGAVSLLLYTNWTPVGEEKIEGLQGRYYLPIAMVLIPAFINVDRLRVKEGRLTKPAFGVMILVLTTAIICSVQFNYQVLDRFLS